MKSHGVTIQVKSLQQFFHVVVFIVRHFEKWNLQISFSYFWFFSTFGMKGKVIRLTRKRLFCCFTCFGQCIGPLETILHNKRFRVVSEQRKTEERLGTGFSVFAAQKWNKNLAWEKSRHFATPPLVSPRIDVWETSAENPCWWRVTTLVWVVLLIGRAAWEIWFDQSEVLPRSG